MGYGKEHTQARKTNISSGKSSDNDYTTTVRYSLSWKNDVNWFDNQLLITGIDYTDEKYRGSVIYTENSRNNVAVFIQNQSNFTYGDLQVGVRRDNNETYGSQTTGSVAYGLHLPTSMRLIGTYATAFRAPTFGDLYFPNHSNPHLKPEAAQHIEVELRRAIGQTHWSVAVFQNTMRET